MGFLIKNQDKLIILKKFNDILQPLIQILQHNLIELTIEQFYWKRIEGQIELHEESRGVHNLYEDLYSIEENIPSLTIQDIVQVCQKLSSENVQFIREEFERMKELNERKAILKQQEHEVMYEDDESKEESRHHVQQKSLNIQNQQLDKKVSDYQQNPQNKIKEDLNPQDSSSLNNEHPSEEEDHPEYSIIGTVQPPYLKDKPSKRYSLVLDLDETLVHYQELEEEGGQFLVRPYAEAFLEEMSQYYEIIIFTAALQDYADFILDIIDVKKNIAHKLYRQHTITFQNSYIKDLSRIGRDMNKTIIIDNLAENFKLQPENGIQIQSWYGEPEDRALYELTPLLKQIVQKKFGSVQTAFTQFRQKTIENLNKGMSEPHLNLSLEVTSEEEEEES